MADTQTELFGYRAEAPLLIPGWFFLSDNCLDEVEREWRKIGAHLAPQHRDWIRFIVQLETEILHTRNARRRSRETRDLEQRRRVRSKRHKDIAKRLCEARELFLQDCADDSRAAASLQQKVGGLDLSEFMDVAMRIVAAARCNAGGVDNAGNRPKSTADRQDFIARLAQICREAGGKPSSSWSNYTDEQGSRHLNAFWRGVAAINRELPPLARAQNSDGVPSVSGLAEAARKGKWLTRRPAGAKPGTSRASIF